jgi:hypothetical protein
LRVKISAALLCATLAGCATGQYTYTAPPQQVPITNTIEIARPIAEVWKTAIPKIGREFFVINNLDQSSGLVNLSYSGNPESFVTCGLIHSTVSNAAGDRRYDFPAASAFQRYEYLRGASLFAAERRTSLEGRINLIFEAQAPDRTRVTANTRYLFTRENDVAQVGTPNRRQSRNQISFNTNQSASFPADPQGVAVLCYPTGKLETDLLELVK